MIPVAQAAVPAEFNAMVRVPGIRSVYEKCGRPVPADYARVAGRKFARVQVPKTDAAGNVLKTATGNARRRAVSEPEEIPGSRFEPYWTEALPWLLAAYDRICAFCCFRIHQTSSPSVDHLIPKSQAWDQAYEWSNYRLAALRMNAKKGVLMTIIDPFDVQPGWFAIELTFGQVIPGPATVADPVLRARVQTTIDELGLNDFAGDRLRDIEAYESGDVSLKRLREESPFVALEFLRQGRLRPEDQQ